MTKKKPLCVAILWHMHQPDYGNVQTGEIYLPWTRFHAAKDYLDMGALIEQTPRLHVTINVVPSLMDQLDAYASGAVRETYAALTLRDAAELEERDKYFLLRGFFQLPYKQMIYPYPRYKELLERRGAADERGEYSAGLKTYSIRDYRDLQVWFNLSWCGHELRRDPEIAVLFRKGKGFAEEDKKRLIEIHNSHAGRVLPFYRRLMESHGSEISVSPYYHPIIPLLCDNRSAREALHSIPLPSNPFSFPTDAREHIRRAQQRYQEAFGRPPSGMWPSEGSVSNATAALAREAGLAWLASDEGVLLQSLQKEGRAANHIPAPQKYSVYRWGEGRDGPCLFFRDHGMSDLIGFTYSNWKAEDASADFVQRLRQIHRDLPDDGRHYVVAVILDGENAWEHFPNNGADFLKLLYHRLTQCEDLRTVTFSEFLDLEPHREELKSLVAGSWIYSNLATWIGHEEKNRAWEFLSAARNLLRSFQNRECDGQQFEKASQEMLIAEGSDWFWWYGDDHPTQNAAEFDALFRNHVKNVYRLLGETCPPELDLPIKKVEVKPQYRKPVHTISPHLDGVVTSYFEWLAAGYATPGGGESMHRSESYLEKVFFGFDESQFYLRLDLRSGGRGGMVAIEYSILLQFVAPRGFMLLLETDQSQEWRCRVVRSSIPDLSPRFAGSRILELGIPLDQLGVLKPEEVRFAISALDKDHELERFPSHGFLAVSVDPWGLDEQEWIV